MKSNMNANPKPQRQAKAKPAKQIMPAPSSGKRARRRRVRAAAPYTSYGVYPNIQAPGTASGSIARAKVGSALKNLYNSKLTEQGNAFLKCAFAPPDFANSDVGGVPDDFQGKSLVKRHKLITAITNAASMDYYYLLLPTPGFAYWVASVPAGTPILPTTTFTGMNYSDFGTMFGGPLSTANIVNRFRFVSNHIEIIPTTNQMTWTGSIQTFKFPVKVILRPDPGSSLNNRTVTGLQSCNSNIADQYSGPFNLGVYAAAYNTGATFAFSDVFENVTAIPESESTTLGDFGVLSPTGSYGFTGMDENFDSVLVKFSGAGSNDANSYLLKTWACVEYQVLANASLYEYQRISPCDKLAIEIYRKVVNELPVGVAFIDNEGFWRRVLDIIRRVTSIGSNLPGQYGMISMGVNTAAEALHQLTL